MAEIHDIILPPEETLDPEDFEAYRKLGHQMVDDMIHFMKDLRAQPVWTKPPQSLKEFLREELPEEGRPLQDIYQDFRTKILPYRKGNVHPRYFSWVEGNGTFSGALSDFLTSVMNSNLGIGDHAAVYLEQQVLSWFKPLMGFPSTSSGVFTDGGSTANLTGLIVARNTFRDGITKKRGVNSIPGHLTLYCSAETHNCIFKAAEIIGIGSDYVRKIAVNERFEIDITQLQNQIQEDRKNGLTPFCLVGNAGTVNTGAIDPLSSLSEIARKENMWFHIDGAIGALLNMLPEFREALKGMTEADSIAFDLHKWLYVNYGSGCVLIRDGELNRKAFIQKANYLAAHERGLSAGPESFSNFGLQLSREFRSLKVWMSLQEHGIDKYRRLIRQNIAQAAYVEKRIRQTPGLEMLTPVNLNIVCFRFNPGNSENLPLDLLNKEILMRLQEEGIAAPSYTYIHNQYAIRMNITNHRTETEDLDAVIEHTVRLGHQVLAANFIYEQDEVEKK